MSSDFLSRILISEYIIAAMRVDVRRLSVVKCSLSEGFRANLHENVVVMSGKELLY